MAERFFCTCAEFENFLPAYWQGRPENYWVDLSLRGEFAPLFVLNGVNSFRKASVRRWCETEFGRDHPELIVNLNQAGFVLPDSK